MAVIGKAGDSDGGSSIVAPLAEAADSYRSSLTCKERSRNRRRGRGRLK